MGMLEKILLGLLLGALAAFPIALFFYLRTAYRQGGWAEVKTASAVFGMALLVWAAVSLWGRHIGDLAERVLKHPLRLTTILLVVLSWLSHRALKSWVGKTHDHH